MELFNFPMFAQFEQGIMFIVNIYIAVIVVAIIGVWKTFTKAGKPGWASIVPIINVIYLLEIAGKPVWWFFLLCIPIVNIVISFIIAIDIAKNGKSEGFGIGLALLPFIFYPILGFGDARFRGGMQKDFRYGGKRTF